MFINIQMFLELQKYASVRQNLSQIDLQKSLQYVFSALNKFLVILTGKKQDEIILNRIYILQLLLLIL